MNELVKIERPRLPTTVGPLVAGLWAALRTYRQIDRCSYRYPHHPDNVGFAIEVRNERLPLRLLLAVDAAEKEFGRTLQPDDDWQSGLASLVMLYRALGAKSRADVDALAKGALAALLSDDLAKVGGWEPVKATPSIVAIAVRKLLQKAIYKPTPAEVVKACRDVRLKLLSARLTCRGWMDDLQAADAVLLHFAHDEWDRPYQLPEYQAALGLMLERHECTEINKVYEADFRKVLRRQIERFLKEETS